MIQLSFKGSVFGLINYLKFVSWCEEDAKKKGAQVEKVFDDLSGYTAITK